MMGLPQWIDQLYMSREPKAVHMVPLTQIIESGGLPKSYNITANSDVYLDWCDRATLRYQLEFDEFCCPEDEYLTEDDIIAREPPYSP